MLKGEEAVVEVVPGDEPCIDYDTRSFIVQTAGDVPFHLIVKEVVGVQRLARDKPETRRRTRG